MIPELLADASPSAVTAPFWEAARAGRLELQRCAACERLQHPPRAICVACGVAESKLLWEPVSGAGEVYAFTVVARALIPALQSEVPYVLAVVQLDEGVRMISLIRGCKPEDVRIGQRVQVAFETVTPEVKLPVFRPLVLVQATHPDHE
jgi:hypothetical protein